MADIHPHSSLPSPTPPPPPPQHPPATLPATPMYLHFLFAGINSVLHHGNGPIFEASSVAMTITLSGLKGYTIALSTTRDCILMHIGLYSHPHAHALTHTTHYTHTHTHTYHIHHTHYTYPHYTLTLHTHHTHYTRHYTPTHTKHTHSLGCSRCWGRRQ